MKDELKNLADLLEKRLQVIGDQEMRANDPEQQLKLLKEVSEGILSHHSDLKGKIPPRLEHFLDNCSYEKALAWIREEFE
jgi:hypothetical protein